jgi:hypothetical protein
MREDWETMGGAGGFPQNFLCFHFLYEYFGREPLRASHSLPSFFFYFLSKIIINNNNINMIYKNKSNLIKMCESLF